MATTEIDIPPIRRHYEVRRGIVSLLNMLRFYAHHWMATTATLSQAIGHIAAASGLSQEGMKMALEDCAILRRDCVELGLPLTVAQIDRLRSDVLQPGTSYLIFRDALTEIQRRVFDELESRRFLALSPEDVSYFDGGRFAANVVVRFPDAGFDIEEAGKSLALERPTACAFHLMRVTEYGVQEISKLIGITDPRPNWEPVIAKIDAELKLPYKDRKFKGSADLLANMSSHLHAVKVAWRNRVMHVEKKHTMEEAREIYAATSGLMRYLADSLPA